jgi:hypothetical protein
MSAVKKPAAVAKAAKDAPAPEAVAAPEPAVEEVPVPRLDPELAAQVVKLRDDEKQPWKAIIETTGKTGPQLRRLYNAGRKAQTASVS